MLPPDYFRDIRMSAPCHIQGKILAGTQIKVVRVFRGPLKRGTILTLTINFWPRIPNLAGDPPLSDHGAFTRAKYVEAFLGGEPPDVVGEQIKFLSHWTWRPTWKRDSPEDNW